jgi:hypothetical protein
MKQTAVEFYRTNLMALVSTGKTDFKTESEIFDQAKEMHLQEIIDAYHINPLETKWENIGKQYYAETYGK